MNVIKPDPSSPTVDETPETEAPVSKPARRPRVAKPAVPAGAPAGGATKPVGRDAANETLAGDTTAAATEAATDVRIGSGTDAQTDAGTDAETDATTGVAPAPKPRRRRAAAAADPSPAADALPAAGASEAGRLPHVPHAAQALPATVSDTPTQVQSDGLPAAAAPAQEASAALRPAPIPQAPWPDVAVQGVAQRPAEQAMEAFEGSVVGVSVEVPEGVSGALEGASEGTAERLSDGVSEGQRSRRRNRRDRKRGERGEANGDASPRAAEAGGAVATPAEVGVAAGAVFAQVLAGGFDIEDAAEPPPEEGDAAEHKRVLAPEPEAPKLHKVLAQAGIGSRRDMEALILDGSITVNGEPAHIGQRISFGDQVKVKGKPVKLRIMPLPTRIIAYHKPVGEIVTHDDPQNRPTVFRRLPRLQQGKWQSVGRLDINTEGLLLFTNSGELANQLMHPRFGVEREYAVRVLGVLEPEAKARLLEGVMVEGHPCGFRSIEEGGGEGANHWYRVVITEGRNREVRKLFDVVGLTVSRLIRIRYGTVVLPHGLKRGVWVDLQEADVRAIRRLASDDRGARDAQPGERGTERGTERGAGQQRPRNERPDGGRPADRSPDRVRGNPAPPRADHGSQGAPAPFPKDRDRAADLDHDPDSDIDFDPRSIPNPLEQTFDKRFVQNPRSPAGGRGFGRGGGGFGAGGSAPAPGPAAGKKGQPSQPDPLQTSLGFFGADAFHRKNRGGGGGGGGGGGSGGRGGNRGGGNFGGGGGGGGFGGGGGGGSGGGRRGR